MDKTETPPSKPNFDSETAAALQAAASMKLLVLLKAKQEANKASSSKEFAVRCVRGLEATIHQLFDVGANTQEVLSQLIEALPSIPVDDLRYALKMLRTRNRKLRVSSQPRTTAPPPPATGATSDLPNWADGSDRRADESDDDYRLRKEIEGPPKARHKFIGEHDA